MIYIGCPWKCLTGPDRHRELEAWRFGSLAHPVICTLQRPRTTVLGSGDVNLAWASRVTPTSAQPLDFPPPDLRPTKSLAKAPVLSFSIYFRGGEYCSPLRHIWACVAPDAAPATLSPRFLLHRPSDLPYLPVATIDAPKSRRCSHNKLQIVSKSPTCLLLLQFANLSIPTLGGD